MTNRIPTIHEIRAFLQGYDLRHNEVMAAVTEAHQRHKSGPAAVRDSYRRSEWELRAEQALKAAAATRAESLQARQRAAEGLRHLQDHIAQL